MTGRDPVPAAVDAPSADALSGPLRLRLVDTVEGLRGLEPTWQRVLAASETRTPFLTYAWALSWWETFGQRQSLHIVVIEDDLGPAAIAPLARVRHRAGPLSYNALELIGTGALRFLGMGLADRADLLLARRREECVAALLRHLADSRAAWDVFDLRFLPTGSTTARTIARSAAAAGLGLASTPLAESPYLPLAGTWEEYLEARGKNFRKGLKRKLGKLEELGEVVVRLDAADTDCVQALGAARHVSERSWKAEAGSALFSHASVREFLARLAPRLAARGELYLALLEVGGAPAAHELGFRFDNKLWSYDSCFDRAFAAGSPGIVLTARLLEQAWQDGAVEYDFMRGGESYKLDWRTTGREELQLVLDSGTPRGRGARRLAYEAKWALKRSPILVDAQMRAVGLLNKLGARGARRDA